MLLEVKCPDAVAGRAFVYTLETGDETLYVGQSRDVHERLRKHRLGLGSRHTHDHPEVRLVYSEGPMLPIEAICRERQLTKWTREKKLALIEGDVDRLKVLSRSAPRAGRDR